MFWGFAFPSEIFISDLAFTDSQTSVQEIVLEYGHLLEVARPRNPSSLRIKLWQNPAELVPTQPPDSRQDPEEKWLGPKLSSQNWQATPTPTATRADLWRTWPASLHTD